MRANGAIGVSQKVKIEAYGQSLDLNRAIARFNGPLANPTLDIDANKPVQGSMVGVTVTGTATVPNVQVIMMLVCQNKRHSMPDLRDVSMKVAVV